MGPAARARPHVRRRAARVSLLGGRARPPAVGAPALAGSRRRPARAAAGRVRCRPRALPRRVAARRGSSLSVTVAAPVSPFKGLAAFDDSELDALFFFGRERERDVVVANL